MIRFGVMFFLCWWACPPASAETCREPKGKIHFFDVGEGDAALIQSSGHSVLIDTGNLISGFNLHKLISDAGVKELGTIILTHPHPDHMGGVFHIAQSMLFHSVHDNGESLNQEPSDLYRWYNELIRKDPRYSPLSKGDSFSVGDFQIQVLSPMRNQFTTDWNTNSLVLSVTLGGFKALLMGDGNLATEAALIRSPDIDLNADLLKIGHHGAVDAGSTAFLKKVSPSLTIISVNEKNIRGYPAAETESRLKGFSKILETKNVGNILISVCGNGSYVSSTQR